MAGFKQTIVEVTPTSRGKGSSSTATLVEMFPASPIHRGELTDPERTKSGQIALKDGKVLGSDGYYGFNGNYSRDFQDNGAPNIPDDVQAGGPGGEPATAFVPNPVPPGPGDVNPANKPAPPATDFPGNKNNSFPGSGGGSSVNPKDASSRMSNQYIGLYISGRSYQGSDE